MGGRKKERRRRESKLLIEKVPTDVLSADNLIMTTHVHTCRAVS